MATTSGSGSAVVEVASRPSMSRIYQASAASGAAPAKTRSRDWFIVVGLAKTGTTIVATTILRTLLTSTLCMEPDDLSDIEPFAKSNVLVVKILFDHWLQPLRQLYQLCRDIPMTIAMVRDPREWPEGKMPS